MITARPEVRAGRVAGRDAASLDRATREIAEREASEHRRYRTLYEIDLDTEPVDFTIDSSERSPSEVVEEIVRFLERKGQDP